MPKLSSIPPLHHITSQLMEQIKPDHSREEIADLIGKLIAVPKDDAEADDALRAGWEHMQTSKGWK